MKEATVKTRENNNNESSVVSGPGGGTLGISGWGFAAGTVEPLTYTRASSAEFCYPILLRSLAQSSQNKTLYHNPQSR